MAKAFFPFNMISFAAHKMFSKPSEFGFQRFAYSYYGDEFVGIVFEPFGRSIYGDVEYGSYLQLSGIYCARKCKEGKMTIRTKYYLPRDPRDPDVLLNREKFVTAVIGWQSLFGVSRFGHLYFGDEISLGWLGLTFEQKVWYNHKAQLKHITGQNLFIREYMSSN